MSYRTLAPKPLNASLTALLKRSGHIGLGLGALTPVLALANPTGGTVIAGSATITNPNANGTVVKETSAAAIIDWQQFNIGKGQYVQFLQPSSSSIILNRVIGGAGSSIYGSLTGNGQIFLVNTNGVFFGKGSSIDAQGFLASTLDISDTDFLARNFVFDKSGSDASVINQGSITAHKGGYVVLAGDYTENDGVIAAQSGHIILASGTKSTLTLNGNSLVSYAVDQATLAQLAGVANAGKLEADGGTVIMTADVANLLKATVVNNTGLIEATSLSNQNGVIQLLATGGNIQNAGTLDVSATQAGQQGGSITLKGDQKTILTDTSKITATGDGADGGRVEVSGDTVAMRGDMALGKGGKLLLDPNKVEIVTGNASSGSGKGTASGANDQIGINFIESRLSSGAEVAISAHSVISHSANAKAITALHANAANSELFLQVHAGGAIKLKGLDINVAGAFDTAVVGTSGGSQYAHESFGFIRAKSVSLYAGSSTVALHGASGNGAGLKKSVVATGGDIVITTEYNNTYPINTTSSGSKGLQLSATGNVVLNGKVTKNLSGTAYSNEVDITAGGNIQAGLITGKNITLKAQHYLTANGANSLDFSAGSNLIIKGAIGSAGGRLDAGITLTAGKTVTLDHGIYLAHSASDTLRITGQQLAYTGSGALVLDAGYGTLILDASIGTAKAPVKYAVDLEGGFKTDVDRSIFTTGSISVVASNGGLRPSSGGSGIHIGNPSGASHAVTLSAKGKIHIEAASIVAPDARVIIGGDGAVSISADDGNAKTTTDDLTISAKRVLVQGSEADASNTSLASVSVDHSVTLHAGHNVAISAASLSIGRGDAFAYAAYGGGLASAKNEVTITAGNDIDLVGKYVDLSAGYASAHISQDSKSAVSATATTTVTLTAGHDVVITATSGNADLSGGGAAVTDFTRIVKQNAVATADAGLSVKAGHDITVTASGHSIHLYAGSAGYGNRVSASQSGAKATATAHADTSFTAGNAITLTASTVNVYAGRAAEAALSFQSFTCGTSCGGDRITWNPVNVDAKGQNAVANLTATANLSLNAGAGGITVTANGGNANLSAGYGVAFGASVNAGSLGGKAALDAEAKVSVLTTGTLSVTGHAVNVEGAGHAAGMQASFSIGSNHGSFFSNSLGRDRAIATAKAGGTANFKADGSVTLQADAITLDASTNELQISAGYGPAHSMEVVADGAHAVATANVDSAVSMTATKGAIKLDGTTELSVIGASAHGSTTAAGRHASVSASFGGKASLAAIGNVALSAHGSASLHADEVQVRTGEDALRSANLHATSSGAAVNASALTGISITAGGAFTATAIAGSLDMSAGSGVARNANVTAGGPGTKANLDAESQLTLTAGGAATLKGKKVALVVGSDTGFDMRSKGSSGGAVALTAKDAIDLTAGGAVLMSASASSVKLVGGNNAARSTDISALHGKVTADVESNIQLSTKGALTLKAAGNVLISAGSRAGSSDGVTAAQGAATVTALSGVDLVVGGAFLASAVSGLNITGANYGGRSGGLTARGPSGKISMTADGSVTITAGGNVTLKAQNKYLKIRGGSDVGSSMDVTASSGAAVGLVARGNVDITAGGSFLASAGSYLTLDAGNYAGEDGTFKANHGTVGLSADAGVHLKAKTSLTLKAGVYVGIRGGDSAAEDGDATAIHGTVTNTALADVSLTAGGNLSATAAGSYLDISAGDDDASDNVANAQGNGSKVALLGNGGVNVSGGNILFKAAGNIDLSGSESAGRRADINAGSGAVVSNTGLGNLVIAAHGKFSASAGGHLYVNGGEDIGESANLDAVGAGAKTTDTDDGTVSITATGAVSLKGKIVSISGSEDAASDASVTANSGGVAALSAKGGVSIAAGGNFLASATNGALDISGGNYAGGGAFVSANHGTATLTADAAVRITAKGTTTLKSKAGLTVSGGSDAAYEASVDATAGKASESAVNGVVINTTGAFTASASLGLNVLGGARSGYQGKATAGTKGIATLAGSDGVTIAAGGAVTFKATDNLDVTVGYAVLAGAATDRAYAKAQGSGAVASLSADSSLTIKGSSVSLTAGGDLSINSVGTTNRSGGKRLAEYASGSAESHGVAQLTANDALTIVTGGAFKAVAGTGLVVHTGDSAGKLAKVEADGAGAKASLTADDTVNITAQSITFSGSNIQIYGGEDDGESGHVGAHAGAATETLKGGINLTASKAFLAQLTGTHSSNRLSLFAQDSLGGSMTVLGSDAGVATANLDNSVNVKAGTITLKTGAHQTSAQLSMRGGSYVAADALTSGDGGKAALTATSALNLTAAGAITLAASHGRLSIYAGNGAGESARTLADGKGAQATFSANNSVNIKGSSLGFTASDSLYIYGAYRNFTADVTVAGDAGGKATATLNGTANLTATGNITLAAGGNAHIYAGSGGDANSVDVAAYGGSADLTAHNDVNVTAGGNITATVGDALQINGAGAVGSVARVYASDAGKAAMTLTGNVNVKAGKVFTASNQNGAMSIYGGGSVLDDASIEAVGKSATTTVLSQANVNITAGTAVNLHAADGLKMFGSDKALAGGAFISTSDGAVANVTADSQVAIKAGTSLNVTVLAGKTSLDAGADGMSGATVNADLGTATVAVNDNVSLTAGSKMNFTLAANTFKIAGGADGGFMTHVNASGATGKATVTITETVSLTAGGAIKETGADALTIAAGAFPTDTTQTILDDVTGGKATATYNSGITIKGSSLSFAHSASGLTKTSQAGLDSDGLVEKGTITISGGHITGFAPDGWSLVDAAAPLELTPSTGESSFGTRGQLGGGVDLSAVPYGTAVDLTPGAGIQLLPSAGSAPLSTLLGDGIVLDLLSLLTAPQPLQLLGTDFTPGQGTSSHTLGSQCLVTLVQDHSSRCSIR